MRNSFIPTSLGHSAARSVAPLSPSVAVALFSSVRVSAAAVCSVCVSAARACVTVSVRGLLLPEVETLLEELRGVVARGLARGGDSGHGVIAAHHEAVVGAGVGAVKDVVSLALEEGARLVDLGGV